MLLILAHLQDACGQGCVKIVSGHKILTPTSGCVPFTFKVQNLYSNSTPDTEYRIDWGDGTVEILRGSLDPVDFTPDFEHVYAGASNTNCGYNVTIEATNACTDPEDARFQVTVSVWDTDEFGLSISPAIINVCQGNAAQVFFTDNTDWNCNPKSANENNGPRHLQWEYLGGTINVAPAGSKSEVIAISGTGTQTALINVPAINPLTGTPYQIGDEFVVQLNYWNYCNPYDDPATPYVPNPATDPGESPPVSTTARIRIVGAPNPNFIVNDESGVEKYSFCIGDRLFPRPAASNLNYTWEFYDDESGTTLLHTATGANPSYQFSAGGRKLIRLKVRPRNVAGSCETVSERIVNVFPLAAAQIKTTNASGNELDPVFCIDPSSWTGTEVRFVDISEDATSDSRWRWEFYDQNGALYRTEPSSGAIDTPGSVFSETYNAPGIYRVRLILWDQTAPECTSTDEKLVRIYANPIAGFAYETTCNTATVAFEDLSSLPVSIDGDKIIRREWDFDYDGTNFSPDTVIMGENPGIFAHNFPGPGSYQVALTVFTEKGTCSSLIVKTVEIKSPAFAEIAAGETEGCTPLTVEFSNLSANNQPGGVSIVEYRWLVDQGTGFIEDSIQNASDPPSYSRTFVNPTQSQKTFLMKLSALTSEGCVVESEPVEIVVYPNIPTGIASDYNPLNSICSPVEVNFSAVISSPSLLPDHYRWLIEDVNGVVKDTAIAGDANFHYIFYNETAGAKNFRISLIPEKAGYCFEPSYQNVTVNGSPSSDYILEQTGDECNFIKYRLDAVQAGLSYHWEINSVEYVSKTFEISFPKPEAGESDDEAPISLTTTDPTTGCASAPTIKRAIISQKEDVQVKLNAVGAKDGCRPLMVNFQNQTSGRLPGMAFEVWIFRDGTAWKKKDPNAGDINDIFTIAFDSAGVYQVELRAVTQSKCVFTSSPSNVVSVFPNPVAAIAADKTHGCAPLTVNFTNASTGTAPGRGGWFYRLKNAAQYESLSSSANASFTFENLSGSELIYEVLYVAETADGCRDSAVQEIHASPGIQASFDVVPVNEGCSPLSLEFRNTAIKENVRYVWDWGDGEPADTAFMEETRSHTFLNITESAIKSYRITLTAEDLASGCVTAAAKNVRVYPEIRLDVAPDVIEGCSPLTVNFSNQTKGASDQQWYYRLKGDDDKFEMTSTANPAYTLENTTTQDLIYEVVYEATNASGCSASQTFEIRVYPELRAFFTANPPQQSLPHRTVAIYNATNEGDWAFEWDFGDGKPAMTVRDPGSYEYETYGIYEIKLTVRNGMCASEHSRVIVIDPMPPIVDFDCDPPRGCRPLTVRFRNLSSFADEDKFTWDFGDGQGISTAQNPVYTYNQPGVYSVTLTASNKSGSKVVKEKKYLIEVYDNPYARFEVRPSQVYIPDMPVEVTNFTFGGDTWHWDFGDGTTYSTYEPQHYYKKKGVYDITLIAGNNEGCYDTAFVRAAAEAVEGGRIKTPNVFTPNPDGPTGGILGQGSTNDVFLPLMEGVTEFRMQIYNRWGELLFETTNKEIGWDGYYQGRLCPQDVYIYKIDLKFADGERTTKVGDVTLLR